jgi:hypothetical protein
MSLKLFNIEKGKDLFINATDKRTDYKTQKTAAQCTPCCPNVVECQGQYHHSQSSVSKQVKVKVEPLNYVSTCIL